MPKPPKENPFSKPTALVDRRKNMGRDYLNKSKDTPPTEFVGKRSNVEEAKRFIYAEGDPTYIYRVFKDKRLDSEYAWSKGNGWHKIAERFRSGVYFNGDRDEKKFVPEWNRD